MWKVTYCQLSSSSSSSSPFVIIIINQPTHNSPTLNSYKEIPSRLKAEYPRNKTRWTLAQISLHCELFGLDPSVLHLITEFCDVPDLRSDEVHPLTDLIIHPQISYDWGYCALHFIMFVLILSPVLSSTLCWSANCQICRANIVPALSVLLFPSCPGLTLQLILSENKHQDDPY